MYGRRKRGQRILAAERKHQTYGVGQATHVSVHQQIEHLSLDRPAEDRVRARVVLVVVLALLDRPLRPRRSNAVLLALDTLDEAQSLHD